MHKPWIGSNYREGGLMLWGFSHHRSADELDDETFTIGTIENQALTGRHWFFKRLMHYFGKDDPKSFWHSVAFANALPTAVLTADRYSVGSKAMRVAVAPRVRHILSAVKPSKVILFSRKGWHLFPEFDHPAPGNGFKLSGTALVEYGTYQCGNLAVTAYCLPHPQFSRNEEMRRGVGEILRHQPSFGTV